MRRVTPEEMDESTPELRDELTMEIGQFYRSNAVVDGRREDEPACLHPDKTRGRAGARVPHAWLPDGRSTIDVAAKDSVWLLGPEASAVEGIPLSAETAGRCGIAANGAMLVRPDGFVAEVR
jgi:putative polyketide hydroxylase